MPRKSRATSPAEAATLFAQAPCRADLAGGTYDIWPLYLFHPGAITVNMAVSILTSCRLNPQRGREIRLISRDTGCSESFGSLDKLMRAETYQHALAAYLIRFFQPKGGFTLETHSESPAGAGISGSSALMIATTAVLARFTGQTLELEQIRVIAQNVEAQLIKVPTGCQDYYPAMYGGVNAIHLTPAGVQCEPLTIAADDMTRRFVLCYTGAPRQSGINNWEVFKQHINGDKKVIRNFEQISQIARHMRSALQSAAWDDVERLLREEWKLRRSNSPRITTPFIDCLIDTARKHGGRAAKVCGAGGGGCVIVLVEEGSRERVSAALREKGGQPLAFHVVSEGLRLQ